MCHCWHIFFGILQFVIFDCICKYSEYLFPYMVLLNKDTFFIIRIRTPFYSHKNGDSYVKVMCVIVGIYFLDHYNLLYLWTWWVFISLFGVAYCHMNVDSYVKVKCLIVGINFPELYNYYICKYDDYIFPYLVLLNKDTLLLLWIRRFLYYISRLSHLRLAIFSLLTFMRASYELW